MNQTAGRVVRWHPEGAERVAESVAVGVEVWAYRCGAAWAAIAYRGRSARATWHYRFANVEQITARAAELIVNCGAWAQGVKDRQAERRAFRHGYQVGDLLSGSWGYDQTNREFWQVTGISEKSVKAREVAHQSVGPAGFMSDHVVPVKDRFTGPEKLIRMTPDGTGKGSGYVNPHCLVSLWDGQPEYISWYA